VSHVDQPGVEAPEGGLIRILLRRNGWAMGALAVATLVVELGVYFGARLLAIGPGASLLAALAAAAVWTALAAPAGAAGGTSRLDALFRGGTVADASAVSLVVLWLVVPHNSRNVPLIGFPAVMKIYCTLAAMALLAVAVVVCARSKAGRHILAVAVAVAFMVLLSSLFWAGAPLAATDGADQRMRMASALLWTNPFSSIAVTVAPSTGFDWVRRGLMYNVTPIRDIPTSSVPWYAAAVCYLCLAGMATAAGTLLRRNRQTVSTE